MNSLPAVALALLFLVSVALIALLIYYIRSVRQLAGFREMTAEVRELERYLDATVFRDGPDLVISGNYKDFPAVVRFSKLENTPGLNIRMSAPANFGMAVVPKGLSRGEGRVVVPTGDAMFDARFVTRTDNATQVKMFLTGKVVLPDLRKLLCSAHTFFGVSRGSLELSELGIPEPYTARHVIGHLESMGMLATAIRMMPGAGTVKIERLKKEGRRAMALGAVAVLLLAVAGVVFAALQLPSAPPPAPPPEGIRPEHATKVPRLEGWRVAAPADFDAAGAQWLRSRGQEAVGFLPVDFSGTGVGDDAVYVLVNTDGERRVVALVNGQRAYDHTFPELAVAARVPRDAPIDWIEAPPSDPAGEGLLLVQDAGLPGSGLVLYAGADGALTGVPVDYQQVQTR